MSERQRLFFALWPSPAERQRLVDCQRRLARFSGRQVVADNLHLTLAFPGSVDAATRNCLEQVATTIRVAPFHFTLDRFGYWKHPKVIWYGPSEAPAELTELAGGLEEAMRQCGLTPDPRPYRPHVTLLRKAHEMPEVNAPQMIWRADSFVLVLSESLPGGVRYSVLRQWPLRS